MPVLPATVPHRRAVLYAAGAVGAVLLLWAGAYLAAGDAVPRGTTVLGVPVGGMSHARAEATLRRELADEARAKVPVRVGDETFRLDPRQAGLALDVPATVEGAGGRGWNPVALFKGLFGGGPAEPVTSADPGKLDAAVAAFAKKVDGKPVEGAVRFDGAKVVAVRPEQGRTLDRPGAAEALRSGYLRQQQPIVLPAEVTDPKVGRDEVARAVREFAEPAMSGPVTLVVDGKRVPLPARHIGTALTMRPDGSNRLQPVLDGGKLRTAVATDLEPFENPATDATFHIAGGRPQVVQAKQGREIDPADLGKAVLPALSKTGEGRTATVTLKVSEPEVTTAAAQGLGVRELVSEYTTFYPSDFRPRLINIHRGADLMDNTLVLPGQTFSLNQKVGERTAERGFAAGYIINRGKLEVDFGGGVSQLATTTFNAAFFAGLHDVEHHPHSFYISRYPEGREATVAWGYKDLRFLNDSGHGIFVTTSYTNRSVTVQLWGTKTYDVKATKSGRYQVKPFKTIHDPRPRGTRPGDCVKQDGVVGFGVDVTRVLYQAGRQVRSERFHTVYQPEDRIVCGSTGPKPPTAKPSGSATPPIPAPGSPPPPSPR